MLTSDVLFEQLFGIQMIVVSAVSPEPLLDVHNGPLGHGLGPLVGGGLDPSFGIRLRRRRRRRRRSSAGGAGRGRGGGDGRGSRIASWGAPGLLHRHFLPTCTFHPEILNLRLFLPFFQSNLTHGSYHFNCSSSHFLVKAKDSLSFLLFSSLLFSSLHFSFRLSQSVSEWLLLAAPPPRRRWW